MTLSIEQLPAAETMPERGHSYDEFIINAALELLRKHRLKELFNMCEYLFQCVYDYQDRLEEFYTEFHEFSSQIRGE